MKAINGAMPNGAPNTRPSLICGSRLCTRWKPKSYGAPAAVSSCIRIPFPALAMDAEASERRGRAPPASACPKEIHRTPERYGTERQASWPSNGDFPEIQFRADTRESLLKTRVFERVKVDGKIRKKNGLYVSHNSFLISASQNVYSRLSLKRANHAEEKSEKRSGRPRRANEAVTCIL
jgi:hypothetical protein